MASAQITLKLLVDTRSQKVLFAEAGKDFVDFLFGLLSLPLGTVITLLDKSRMVGSLGNIYASLENLSQEYILPDKTKDSLLNPTQPVSAGVPLLQITQQSNYSTYNYHQLQLQLQRAAAEGGYVKSAVTYMVYDDLVVKPMSAISGIAILKNYDIKDVEVVQEKMVQVTMSEGLKLLKASLETKEALTTVFLSDYEDGINASQEIDVRQSQYLGGSFSFGTRKTPLARESSFPKPL